MASKRKKEGLSQTQVFALLIVIVMLGSTVAIGLYSLGNQPQDPDTPDQPLDTGDQTAIPFSASTEGSVVRVLPQVVFFGPTPETDIQKIDAVILSVPGVLQIGFQSSFRDDPDSEALLYVANFSFDPALTNSGQILTAASNPEVFSNTPFLFAQALVSVPSRVTFRSEQLDLNREYLFLDQLIQAYVSASTEAEDIIQVQLDATFTGATLTELIASETANSNAQIQQRQATRLYQIHELFPEIVFSFDANYTSDLEPDILKPKLLAIPNVNTAEVLLQPMAPLSVHFSFQDDQTRSDVNQLFSDYNRVKSFSIQPSASGFDVYYELFQNSDYTIVKTELKNKFSAKGWSETVGFSFSNWIVRLSVKLETASTDNKAAADRVKTLLSAYSTLVIYQPAQTNIPFIEESILNPDLAKYYLDANVLPINVFPGKKINEPAVILIKFLTQRDRVVQVISAVETTGVQSTPGNPDENPFNQ